MLLVVGGLAGASAQSAYADTHGDTVELPFECEVTGSSAVIHLAYCPNMMEDADLRDVAQLVCGDNPACGVWIWSDRAQMPARAPENHDGLTQEQITSAVAVWDNDGAQLIRIDRE